MIIQEESHFTSALSAGAFIHLCHNLFIKRYKYMMALIGRAEMEHACDHIYVKLQMILLVRD